MELNNAVALAIRPPDPVTAGDNDLARLLAVSTQLRQAASAERRNAFETGLMERRANMLRQYGEAVRSGAPNALSILAEDPGSYAAAVEAQGGLLQQDLARSAEARLAAEAQRAAAAEERVQAAYKVSRAASIAQGIKAFDPASPEFAQAWRAGIEQLGREGIMMPEEVEQWRDKPNPGMLDQAINAGLTADQFLEQQRHRQTLELGRQGADTIAAALAPPGAALRAPGAPASIIGAGAGAAEPPAAAAGVIGTGARMEQPGAAPSPQVEGYGVPGAVWNGRPASEVVAPLLATAANPGMPESVRTSALAAAKPILEAMGATSPDIIEWQRTVEDQIARGLTPPSFWDYQLSLRRAGAQTAERQDAINLSNQRMRVTDSIIEGYDQATKNLETVDRLEDLLKGLEPGTFSGIASWVLANTGIDIGGGGDIQAAQALIEALVPQQRQPGTGTQTDRDAAGFRASLPSIWGTKEGNKVIIETLRGLYDWKTQRANLAMDYLAGDFGEGQQAFKALMDKLEALPNPFEKWRNAGGDLVGLTFQGKQVTEDDIAETMRARNIPTRDMALRLFRQRMEEEAAAAEGAARAQVPEVQAAPGVPGVPAAPEAGAPVPPVTVAPAAAPSVDAVRSETPGVAATAPPAVLAAQGMPANLSTATFESTLRDERRRGNPMTPEQLIGALAERYGVPRQAIIDRLRADPTMPNFRAMEAR